MTFCRYQRGLPGSPKASWWAVPLIIGAVMYGPARAADALDLRIDFGTRIFRALMAADVDLARKASGTQLPVVVLYHADSARADALAKSFNSVEVRGLSVSAESTDDGALSKPGRRVPAAIFIAEPLRRESLHAVVRYGIEHGVIVYSPFEGDVENGVLGGISIEAQVRPFVNRSTLDASRITLKSVFLDVAKVYQ